MSANAYVRLIETYEGGRLEIEEMEAIFKTALKHLFMALEGDKDGTGLLDGIGMIRIEGWREDATPIGTWSDELVYEIRDDVRPYYSTKALYDQGENLGNLSMWHPSLRTCCIHTAVRMGLPIHEHFIPYDEERHPVTPR